MARPPGLCNGQPSAVRESRRLGREAGDLDLAPFLDVLEPSVDAVAGGQHRGDYRNMAMLAVACAEPSRWPAKTGAGAGFIDPYHARCPRHSAFRRELREMAARSPLL